MKTALKIMEGTVTPQMYPKVRGAVPEPTLAINWKMAHFTVLEASRRVKSPVPIAEKSKAEAWSGRYVPILLRSTPPMTAKKRVPIAKVRN